MHKREYKTYYKKWFNLFLNESSDSGFLVFKFLDAMALNLLPHDLLNFSILFWSTWPYHFSKYTKKSLLSVALWAGREDRWRLPSCWSKRPDKYFYTGCPYVPKCQNQANLTTGQDCISWPSGSLMTRDMFPVILPEIQKPLAILRGEDIKIGRPSIKQLSGEYFYVLQWFLIFWLSNIFWQMSGSYYLQFNYQIFQILVVDPLDRYDHYFRTGCPSVRPETFKIMRISLLTGNCGLAEWIIDDSSCLVLVDFCDVLGLGSDGGVKKLKKGFFVL